MEAFIWLATIAVVSLALAGLIVLCATRAS